MSGAMAALFLLIERSAGFWHPVTLQATPFSTRPITAESTVCEYKKLTGAILIRSFCPSPALPYNEPLCAKCLHPMELHTYVLARLDGREARRCSIGTCSCIIMAKIK